jgi:hypothetical protein
MQYAVLLSVILFPSLLHAQAPTITAIVFSLRTVVDNFIGAAVAVALLVFVWGVVSTMIGMNSGSSGSEKAITEGKQRMVWGVVGLFVIVSIWGLVGLLGQLFDVSLTNPSQATPVVEIH